MNHEQTTTSADPSFWAAPEIAKAGYRVLPVGLDKAPSVPGGFYAATTDASKIAEWITEGRADHDIAIPTGLVTLVVVMDADTVEAYEEMRARHGEPHVKTKRGGHWYFRHPQDGKVTSRPIGPGLDCKADGGYVVVPPSRDRTWTHGIPELGSLPELPKDLKRRVREDPQGGGPGRRKPAGPIGEEISNGSRNRTLASLGGTMRRRGMGEAEILAALEVTNRLRCKPPLPDEEVRQIVQSVTRYEPASGPWWIKVVSKNV